MPLRTRWVLIALALVGLGWRYQHIAGAPARTPLAAADWTGTSGLRRWRMEEATGANRLNTAASCGDCSGSGCCTLSENGIGYDVEKDTTIFQEGTAAARFDPLGSFIKEFLECTDANCGGSSLLDPAGDFSFGCRLYADSTQTNNVLGKYDTTNTEGYRGFLDTGGTWRCGIANPSGADPLDVGPSYSAATWFLGACVFDDTADTLEAFVDGVGSGSPASYTGACCDNTVSFSIGALVTPITGIQGRVDECFFVQLTLTAAEQFYVTHCNWTGEWCACDSSDPAAFLPCTTDANCQAGGGAPAARCDTTTNTCRGLSISGGTISACNAAAPS